MILILNTAFETAEVTLCHDEDILAEEQSNSQKNHSTFLEPAIKNICRSREIELKDINAFAVVNGPGSYTGLRVGLSSAKALCYALQKPLILLNTLDVMAKALKMQSRLHEKNILFCPLIDARRDEVFTALYDSELNIVKDYSSQIINEDFLKSERQANKIISGGSGSLKWQKIVNDNTIDFKAILSLSQAAVILSNQSYVKNCFSDIAYSEPFYLKPVYFRKS